MIRHPRSIRLRLSLWFSAAMALILLVFAAAVYGATWRSLTQQLRRGLHDDFGAVRSMLQEDPNELYELHEHGAVKHFAVRNRNSTLYSSATWLAGLDESEAVTEFTHESSSGEEFVVHSGLVVTGGTEYLVAVARSEEFVHRSLYTLAAVIALVYPFAMALAFGGGYLVTDRMLSPIDAMANRAKMISTQQFSERLPVESDDELGRLANIINSMLTRLEEDFLRLKQFTSDASHELRTPLTVIRSVGEVGLRHGLEPHEYRETITSILEETTRLTHLVDDLLTLARADAQDVRVERSDVDLTALVREVVELLSVLCETKQQSITVDARGPVMCFVNQGTLRHALINILDNAIKYTPEGGQIRIQVKQDEAHLVHVTIDDSGPGIPGEHMDAIFERFYRVEKERGGRGGAGLGLAIARWAVEANDGLIAVRNTKEGGSSFCVTLLASVGRR